MKNEKKILEHLYKLRNYIYVSNHNEFNIKIVKVNKKITIKETDFSMHEEIIIEDSRENKEYFKFEIQYLKLNTKNYLYFEYYKEALHYDFNRIDEVIKELKYQP